METISFLLYIVYIWCPLGIRINLECGNPKVSTAVRKSIKGENLYYLRIYTYTRIFFFLLLYICTTRTVIGRNKILVGDVLSSINVLFSFFPFYKCTVDAIHKDVAQCHSRLGPVPLTL